MEPRRRCEVEGGIYSLLPVPGGVEVTLDTLRSVRYAPGHTKADEGENVTKGKNSGQDREREESGNSVRRAAMRVMRPCHHVWTAIRRLGNRHI